MDHQYWDLIREGDEQAFRTLYSLYEDRLFRYGIGIAHNEELVNNAIQTLFTYLFERRKRLSVPVSLYAYLASSLRRLILKELAKKRNNCLSIDQLQFVGCDFALEIDAEASMVRAECSEQAINGLQVALNGLTNMQREIIYLRYYEGLDNKGIAEVTGYADKTIRNVVSTALARLRKDKTLSKIYS
ncbi:sigma-70 family RNA polymerase sigma factor [uncultured Alistipes sp.]|uniref:RNA polymerase sigma factor n=1 Tax=uncultured Alistipes sp. TaxID=538949 RepID=UPI0025FC4414|nr:sigma-70 family RNA polymerase sigma factor [uncultured Alistipes sp.]